MAQGSPTPVADPCRGLGRLVDLLDDAEADRDEIADRLHDGPVQSLMVARYAADAAVGSSDPERVREAVQQAVVEVRRMIWQLRPRGESSLVEALGELSAKLVEAGGAALALEGEADADLTGAAGVTAYRLVQAVAQPEGGPVHVSVHREPQVVVTDVEGGSPLPSPERWARRAAALGGDLSSGAGRLRLTLPFHAFSGDDARTTP